MKRWTIESAQTLFEHPLFALDRQRLAAEGEQREAVVLRAPAWVNVIPLTGNDEVLLIRQWRFGVESFTLEIPGGMVESAEEFREAAARELFEETGYRARGWERLGELHPNPAFIDNRIATYLATDLERIGDPLGDGEEEITVEPVPLKEIPNLIMEGRITHSLVVAAFYLLDHR